MSILNRGSDLSGSNCIHVAVLLSLLFKLPHDLLCGARVSRDRLGMREIGVECRTMPGKLDDSRVQIPPG